MTWLQLQLTLAANETEHIEAALLTAGAQAITFKDAASHPLYEPDAAHPPIWPQTQLTALFTEDTDPEALRAMLVATLGVLPLHCFRALEDREWSREWLKDFKPMRFGQRLWIIPSAYSPSDRNAINIQLDPGLAFGTGTHATTALCLEWLDGADLSGKTVIDYGCGSGILAIAAARLGAQRVWAVDNDPQALTATHENAARNQVSPILETSSPAALPNVMADVLLSNILAAPLVELARYFAAHMKSGASLVLSGILDSQRDGILVAYAPWFRFTGDAQRAEWLRLDGLRLPGNP